MLINDIDVSKLKHKLHPSELRVATRHGWAEMALKNFEAFLQDHAACERKACASAMSLIAKYPHRITMVDTLGKLAQEELEHFQQVFTLLRDRGWGLGKVVKDVYVNLLRKHIRHSEQEHFMDQLLVSGLVEARSCERFAMMATALETQNPELSAFYDQLARVEARHNILFVRLAHGYLNGAEVDARLDELLDIEAQIVDSLPVNGLVH
jgi:tRNA 2-(methylsulfanyl)-N6-isopentenyladenosine37 hydroxylase